MLLNKYTNHRDLFTFALQLRNRNSHINKIFALILLWVFAIAITPWSAFHNHEGEEVYCNKDGKMCMHKVHVRTQTHNCLICSAHFEKNYHTSEIQYIVRLQSKVVVKNYTLVSASYVTLISSSLRAPPAA